MKMKKMELYMEKSSKLTIISEDNEMTTIFLIPYKGMGIYGEESTNLNINGNIFINNDEGDLYRWDLYW